MKTRKDFAILFIIQSFLFLYVFINKILRLNGIFFADNYDASKNYFTYYYYTYIQKSNNGFFEGMNYPFGEYIFYTDNTPIIAFTAKLFGLESYSIGYYNAIFLLLWFIVPFVAFKVLRLLNVQSTVAIVFSLLMCWTNPLLNHFVSTVNLSLFVFYLLTLYYFLRHVKAISLSTQLYFTCAQIILICIAAFFHLYYLPIILLFLGGAYLTYSLSKKKYYLLWQALLLATVATMVIYGVIISVDQYYDIRPSGASGYGYNPFRNNLSDFVTSYEYLDFPNPLHHTEWAGQKWTFLGNGYILAMLLSFLAYPLYLKKKIVHNKKIILSLLIGGGLCLLVSMGNTIQLYAGKTLCDNILNPLFFLSKVTDFVTHFRFLRRFSAPFWTVYFIWLSILSNAAWNGFISAETQDDPKNNLTKYYALSSKILVLLFIAISSFDAFQYIQRHSVSYEKENLFSQENLTSTQDFTGQQFEAILSIPYFHVGGEIHEYVIDDPDHWSKDLYKLSIKNKIPLMACKMCRIPDTFTKQSFSVFEKEIDPSLAKTLKNKKILLAVSKKDPWMNQDKAYVQKLKGNLNGLIKRYDAQLILENDLIAYYEMYIQ